MLALPRLDAKDIHGVDLLETAALTLAQEEVHDDGAGETAPCEDVAVLVVDAGSDEGGEEGEEEVPHPVAGGGQGHALGSIAGRVDLANDGPDYGAPGGGKRGDEETRDDDHAVADALGLVALRS